MPEPVQNAQTAVNDNFLSKLASAAADLASLDVMTLTGAIELKPQANAVSLDPGDLYAALQGAVGNDGKSLLRVVALTHKAADHDSTTFIAENLSEADAKLVEAHHEMVDLADRARLETVRLLARMVGLSVG